MLLNVQMSPGEFLDKVSILEIKSERIQDPAKLANVRRELELLNATWKASPLAARDVSELLVNLKRLNEELWDVEDELRAAESRGAFDATFVRLARSVYQTNDQRSAVKRELNVVLGSDLIEEKSYPSY